MLDDTGYRTLNADTVPKRWKSFACAASIVAIIAVAAAIALTIDDLKQRDKLNDASSTTMLTPGEALRRSTSDIMKANMNFSVDPCEDFYEYSCGGWLSRTTIPADKKQVYFVIDDIDQYNQEVLKGILTSDFQWEPITPYYALCMNRTAANAAGMKPLANYLQQIDALSQSDTYQSDLIKVVAQLHLLSANAFFSYSSAADLYTPTLSVGQLQQGGIQLPGKSYYFPNMSDPNATYLISNYTAHINNMLKFLGVDSPQAGPQIVALEIQLANVSMSTVDQRDINGTYHLVNLTGLLSMSSLPWIDYLVALGVPPSDLSKPQEYPINVASLNFIKGMDKLISTTNVSIVQSYLRWTLIHANAAYLTDAVETENFNFFGKILSGVTQQQDRTKKCIGKVDSMLGQILGKYYIREAFTASAKNLTTAMMNSVLAAMHTKLEHVEFMNSSPETRAKAIEKLRKFKEQIGYPDVWKSYDGLKLDHSSYFADSVAITQSLNRETVQNVNHPVDRNAWGMTTPTVNAYYDPSANQIVIPAGILQGLYFNELFHPAINYGGTGGTQGHEMTHGFDDQGAQYDGDGKFVNWWAPAVLAEWNKNTACLSDFYSQYLVLDEPHFKLHLDGNLTNGENIADVGGLKQAFHAYQTFVNVTTSVAGIDTSKPYFDWLSNEQLFFVSYAQGWCEKSTRQATIQFQTENPHSPGKFRVNGPVTQNRDFALVFGCTIGKNTMAPEKICDIW